ncbi:MAG TPA: permease prefix domain 1-containing protein [Bryobacteraceae bacterium]|nr:permease prefix domain 1-containing protein [Bryobacteraceae bacterium]
MTRTFWRRRKQRERDLERELRAHLNLEAEEQRAHGLSVEEARYTAQRASGNTTLIKEETREMWGWTSMERIGQDLSQGARIYSHRDLLR